MVDASKISVKWTFDDSLAVRGNQPLIIGLAGPSFSGKTFSALRIATGIQRVTPGEIFLIDSENGRGKHYAPLQGQKADGISTFSYRRIDLQPPFSTSHYLAAIRHAIAKGARTIIVDSGSHLQEGEGGIIQEHAAQAEKLAEKWRISVEKAGTSAWVGVKGELKAAVLEIKRMDVNLIWCFRAAPKIDFKADKPTPMGFMPIAPKELWFEMDLCFLLYPGCEGFPTWHPDDAGEKTVVKLPIQFKSMFTKRRQLDESVGAELARWACPANAPGEPPRDDKTPAVVTVKPSAKELDALREALIFAGVGTDDLRRKFIVKTIGHNLESMAHLTMGELDACLQAAKEV